MYKFSQAECEALAAKTADMLRGPNDTVHLNHDGCPAGVDSKRRLYATTTEDGSGTIFYCHHCQGKGFFRWKRYTSKLSHDPCKGRIQGQDGTFTETSGTLQLEDLTTLYTGIYNDQPPLYVDNIHKDFVNSKVLLNLAEVWDTLKNRDYYGLRIRRLTTYTENKQTIYSNPYYRILLPTFEDGTVTGLWIRNHPKSDTKVIVYGSAKKILYDTEEKERSLVIVEDPISAIKLDCLGVPAYSLGGLDMTAGEVIKLRALYDRIIVWLDNDKASDKVVDTIVRTLQLAGYRKVLTVRSAPEPKKCEVQRIKEELQSVGVACKV